MEMVTINYVTGRMADRLLGFLGRWKTRCFSILQNICLLKVFRDGPTVLPKMAFSALLSIALTCLWYLSQTSDGMFGRGRFTHANSLTNKSPTNSGIPDGLRIVVFGGGDVATPTLSINALDDQKYAWTEVMSGMRYLSLVYPKTEDASGAVLSNSLLDAAYKRMAISRVGPDRDDNTNKLDYSWATTHYPQPHQYDLAAQVDSFLASSRKQQVPTESLWVFNVGYWDIWYLTALPRRLAIEVLDSSAQDLFFQIERLYQAEQAAQNRYAADGTPQAPFRIFLTRLFDISLTPGFASARPKPPHPHSSASQLRNAAFLTGYWNALLEVAVDNWVATPDPEFWSTADTVDIKVAEALAGKRPLESGNFAAARESEAGDDRGYQTSRGHKGRASSPPRREVASYGISRYLQELMIDRQLRDSDLSDHNGLGARPAEDGFLDISVPCAPKVAGDGVVCQEPDNYLFYTEFTVGQRAIREIGVRAARRFLDHVETGSRWREKAMMHKESGRGRKGHE